MIRILIGNHLTQMFYFQVLWHNFVIYFEDALVIIIDSLGQSKNSQTIDANL